MQLEATQATKPAQPTFPTYPPNLRTIKQFARQHPAFSESGLRNLVFMAEKRHTNKGTTLGNGLGAALVRIGRRVLIDEQKFFEWVESQQGACAPKEVSHDH